MNRIALFMISLFILATHAFAQQQNVNGLITDQAGEPLIGATVMVKGSNIAAVSDLDGKFSIKAKTGDTLKVSYVGFKPQSIKIADMKNLTIVMQEEANTLDEMVVVGYGTMKKADLTGAVTNVDGGKLENMRSSSVSQSLQGTMPGLYVSRSSGLPGAEATIRVRGVTTIGNSDPLVIVDGIPDSMESVNSSDIESISVLKDAASASIYGARAAAGVILITTKKAKEGKAKVEYQGTAGFVQATETPKPVGAVDYMNLYNELKWNDGGNQEGQEYSAYDKDFIDSYYANHLADPDAYPITDWQNILMRKTAPTTKHDLKVSYGNKVVQTKVSLGYEYTEALYEGRDYQRLTARVNNTFKVTKWLTFGLDAYYRRGITRQPQINPLGAMMYMTPLDAAVWQNGTYGDGHNGENPLAGLREGGKNNQWTDRFGAKLSVILNPIEGLTISGIWAPGLLFTQKKSYRKKVNYYTPDNADDPAGFAKGFELNKLTEDRNLNSWGTKQLFINYNKTFAEDHRTDFMIGYEDYTASSNTLQAESNNMDLSDYFYMTNANVNDLGVDGTETQNAYRSIFGRINYSYKGRYMAQFNARWDRSSRFGSKYRTGFFPSASVGWTMSEEAFLRDVDPRILSFLKIRGSYGTLGNERIGNYPYQANMTFSHPVMVDSKGQLVSVLSASQRDYNIPDITWETTHSWDVGLDATFLNSRLSLTFDWYWKKTKDMLLSIQLPVFMGYDNPKQNAGEMTTKGWDLQLGWRDNVGDFSYAVNFNISDYRSVMGRMSGTVLDSGGHITMEGEEYNAWYGFLSNGLYQNDEDVANNPVLNANVKPGDIKYKDISGAEGMPDGAISSQYDRVVLGSSQPRLIYGAQISAGWKGIELSAAFNGIGKQNVMMTRAMMYQRHAAGWTQFTGEVIGTSWSYYNTPEQNLAAKYPRLSDMAVESNGNNTQTTDFWMFNGGYFRCKNITLGYSFQQNILKKLRLNSLRVFASVSDPFSIDRYPQGWDPETAGSSSSYIARTWNFGVAVSF